LKSENSRLFWFFSSNEIALQVSLLSSDPQVDGFNMFQSSNKHTPAAAE
jgi:hypothetical protein